MATCDELAQALRLPGTSFREEGKSVSISPGPDEAFEFYRTDDDMVRMHFGHAGRMSDVLVVRTKPVKARAAYIELKGSHLEKAVEQLRSTMRTTRAHVGARFGVDSFSAIVVLHGGSPVKNPRRKLEPELQLKHFEVFHRAKPHLDLRTTDSFRS